MTNPLTLLPARLRLAAYLAYAVGSVVVTYLVAKGHAGDAESAAWVSLGALLGLTAGSNVSLDE